MSTIVYAARRIVTMNPNQPFATHVAVRDGRILGAGTLESLRGWGKFDLDERFADKVILPGFVEGHSHAFEGGVWKFPYVGFFDRTSPDGKRSPGLKNIAEVVAALQAHEKTMPKDGSTLFAWGFDPIYFTGRRMNLGDLDKVSTGRSVIVLHSNFHVLNANTPVFAKAKITRHTNVHGIVKDEAGEPTGELQENTAKYLAYKAAGIDLSTLLSDEPATWGFARVAQLAGVTTATDLHNTLPDSTVEAYLRASGSADFPLRLLPAFAAIAMPPEEGIVRLKSLMKKNNERLRFGLVKIVTDGSIQGLSARMRWPGYYDGTPNGVWNIGPDEIDKYLLAYHRAGFQVHVHTNGDEASEVAIESVERALAAAPRWDHRHTLQHAQMADAGQFRRMKALGMCANLFANHLFYWGDIHYARTLGPERAERMDACGTALSTGVPFAIHCDAPVTPIGPLFTAWCAVNRLTASGRTLGETEKIPVAEALRAITLGAAYTLKLDEELGSIDVGKRADFAILDDDPLAVAPEKLKDVPVWGTVLGGKIFQAPRS
jgi:predicted amidohydrolase YtcJ